MFVPASEMILLGGGRSVREGFEDLKGMMGGFT